MIWTNLDVEKYDLFLVDLWGTVHDGRKLYDGIIDTLEEIKTKGKKIYFFDKGSIYETYTTRDDVKSGTFRCFDTETGEIKSYGDKYLRCISKYVGGHYIYLISKPDRDIHANEADMYRLDVRTDQIEKAVHLSADNQVNADYYNNGKILFLELDYPGENSTVHIVSASTGGELFRVEISDGGYGVLGKGFLRFRKTGTSIWRIN